MADSGWLRTILPNPDINLRFFDTLRQTPESEFSERRN